jgi:hypothetical protein
MRRERDVDFFVDEGIGFIKAHEIFRRRKELCILVLS